MLSLPPISVIRCDEATARSVHAELTSVIAGHPQATTTFRFYEEVDAWLGPWGERGYPIGYGKFYNVAFSTNEKLQRNPATQQWVWRTTIRLQEALRNYLVSRIRNCTIGSLTEPELRRAAFNSHPQAYDDGGLATVALAAPELIPIITTIPGKEFNPASSNFDATVRQVFLTMSLVAPKTVGGGLAALAGPAHSGIFNTAVQRDQQAYRNLFSIPQQLGRLRMAIQSGEMDHIPRLDEIIRGLNAREFPNQAIAGAAREVVELAEQRKRLLQSRYQHLLQNSPEVRSRIQSKFPEIGL